MTNLVNPANLVRVSNFAHEENQTVQNIYKRLKTGKLKKVLIDGVQFVEIENK